MLYYVLVYEVGTNVKFDENVFNDETTAEIWGQEVADFYCEKGFCADYDIDCE